MRAALGQKWGSAMKKLALLTLTASLLGTAQVALAAPSNIEGLVALCAREAARSHDRAWKLEPTLRPTIEAHRDLMSAACARWLSSERTEVLLTQCLSQAASGPRHIRHGRNMDRTRIQRQQDLCRKIAAGRNS